MYIILRLFFYFFIFSYCETAGLEGNFVARVLKRSETDFDYQLKLRGKIYKETDFTDVLLTTKGEDKPSDFKFKASFYWLSKLD